jgi:soluble lytic murein transglycosylase
VRDLIDWGAEDLASRQWSWVRRVRGAMPAEGVAAAVLENRRGRRLTAVRWLRASVPELGTVAMSQAPREAVRLYLPLRFKHELVTAAAEAGVEPWLLAGLVRQESLFGAGARSSRGAMGLAQLLRNTARPHAVALGLGRSPDLYDPEVNLRIGARELARLIRRFGALEPALAAYNAGETRARRWWRQWPQRGPFVEAIPIPETYNYVRRVSYLSEAYRLVYADQWRSTP